MDTEIAFPMQVNLGFLSLTNVSNGFLIGVTLAKMTSMSPSSDSGSSSFSAVSVLPLSVGLAFSMDSDDDSMSAVLIEASFIGAKFFDAGVRLYFPANGFGWYVGTGIKGFAASDSSYDSSSAIPQTTMFYVSIGCGLLNYIQMR